MSGTKEKAQPGWSRRKFLQTAGIVSATGAVGLWLPAGASASSKPGMGADAGGEPPIFAPRSLQELSYEEIEAVLSDLVKDLDSRSLYASAQYEEWEGFSVRANDRDLSVSPTPRRSGVVFQAYDGHHFREASTDRVDRDSLRRVARGLQDQLERPPAHAARLDAGTPLVANRRTSCEIDPAGIPVSEWKQAAQQYRDRAAAIDERIRSVTAGVETSRRFKIFVNRSRRLRQELIGATSGMFAFAADGKNTGQSWVRNRQQGGFEITALDDARFEEFNRILDDSLRSERITPGDYEIISAPEVTGLLAHESFGHGVEYDQFIKGRAKAAQFLNKRVAPPNVQIYDDPGYPGAHGSYFFDDEGMPAEKTQIVRDGVFVQPLTDLFSSLEGSAKRTPNGRRESFARKAYARMSNTYFGSGTDRIEDMIASVDDGMYLQGFQSGMEDPHGWGIQLTCHRAYEIKNGELTGRVFSPIGVTGYVPDILESISMVSDAFELTPGTCGKGHKENVPVTDGGPHLKFRATLG